MKLFSRFNKKTHWLEALNEKDPIKSEKILLKAEKQTHNIIDLHFTYNQLIELYYKQRDKSPEALDKCINYCQKDIELFPNFKDKYIEEELSHSEVKNLPRIPSFQKIAIIYEKQEKFEEAIKVCQLAINYGLEDGTKSGFTGRYERLNKKLKKRE